MARIAGIDLPRNKRAEIALTYIFGIGRSTAQKILIESGVDLSTKTDNLTEAEVAKIREYIDKKTRREVSLKNEKKRLDNLLKKINIGLEKI